MADTILVLTVPEAYNVRVYQSFTAVSDTDMVISCRGSRDEQDGSDFTGHVNLRIEPQAVGETDKNFVKRVLKEIGLALIKLYETKLAQDRFDADVNALDPVSVDVPDDIVV